MAGLRTGRALPTPAQHAPTARGARGQVAAGAVLGAAAGAAWAAVLQALSDGGWLDALARSPPGRLLCLRAGGACAIAAGAPGAAGAAPAAPASGRSRASKHE